MADMILAAAILALIVVAILLAGLRQRLHAAQRQQLRNETAVAELQLAASLRAQLAAGQAIAENVVEGGTSTVRAVHKGIASIPFGILESIPVTRDTTRVVRQIHDAISDSVYGSISATNKAVHQVARDAAKPVAKSEEPQQLKGPNDKQK